MGWISWIWEWAILDGKFNPVVFCAGISTLALAVKEVRSWFTNWKKIKKEKLEKTKAKLELTVEVREYAIFAQVKNTSETAAARNVTTTGNGTVIAPRLNPGESAVKQVGCYIGVGAHTMKIEWLDEDGTTGTVSEVYYTTDRPATPTPMADSYYQ